MTATAGEQFNTVVTATSVAGGVAFTCLDSTGLTLKARAVLVINGGSSSAVYVDFTTTSGSTGGWPLRAGESTSISAKPHSWYTGLSYATTGVTSIEMRVLATR